MGIIAAVFLAGGYITLQPDGNLHIDWWIPFLAYSAIAIGTVWGGWKIIETMGLRITAWVITIPSTVIIGWLIYQFTQLPGAAAWIAVGSVLFVLGGWIAWAMARALHASDVAAESPPKKSFANRYRQSPTSRATRWLSE